MLARAVGVTFDRACRVLGELAEREIVAFARGEAKGV
jgi:hypothetical protein